MLQWRNLDVWQKSHELVLQIYKTASSFPKDELYGLTGQLKRAVVSIPANIVEGQSRHTTKEYIQFLYNARGSLEETRYYLLASKDLKFIDEVTYEDLEAQSEKISKMLNGLISSLKRKLSK